MTWVIFTSTHFQCWDNNSSHWNTAVKRLPSSIATPVTTLRTKRKTTATFLTGLVIQDMSGSWCIKGIDESALVMDSPVPLMHHDPDRSWITIPDPDHHKGTQPKLKPLKLVPLLLMKYCTNETKSTSIQEGWNWSQTALNHGKRGFRVEPELICTNLWDSKPSLIPSGSFKCWILGQPKTLSLFHLISSCPST